MVQWQKGRLFAPESVFNIQYPPTLYICLCSLSPFDTWTIDKRITKQGVVIMRVACDTGRPSDAPSRRIRAGVCDVTLRLARDRIRWRRDHDVEPAPGGGLVCVFARCPVSVWQYRAWELCQCGWLGEKGILSLYLYTSAVVYGPLCLLICKARLPKMFLHPKKYILFNCSFIVIRTLESNFF